MWQTNTTTGAVREVRRIGGVSWAWWDDRQCVWVFYDSANAWAIERAHRDKVSVVLRSGRYGPHGTRLLTFTRVCTYGRVMCLTAHTPSHSQTCASDCLLTAHAFSRLHACAYMVGEARAPRDTPLRSRASPFHCAVPAQSTAFFPVVRLVVSERERLFMYTGDMRPAVFASPPGPC